MTGPTCLLLVGQRCFGQRCLKTVIAEQQTSVVTTWAFIWDLPKLNIWWLLPLRGWNRVPPPYLSRWQTLSFWVWGSSPDSENFHTLLAATKQTLKYVTTTWWYDLQFLQRCCTCKIFIVFNSIVHFTWEALQCTMQYIALHWLASHCIIHCIVLYIVIYTSNVQCSVMAIWHS